MGMAVDHLAADGRRHVVEGEGAFLLGHARVVDHLEQEIAQFLA